VPTLPIPPVTVPAGTQVFGPLAVPGGFAHVTLTVDIANLTAMDVTVETSTDGGTIWRHVVSEAGLRVGLDKQGLPITTATLSAQWAPPGWPGGLVRVTLTNAVAFASAGGSLVVS
jgi:hypothetical protein